ncbi:MAG: alkaline phosphatase family protein [Chloroflexota bacterium]|nr:alkaline phosphatase family protein [Chloroflexota bacterium]
MKRKVAVFGLDGITFDLLRPWLDEGWLPNLARLMENGASGPLRSTIPPVSASAWASFATGTNPGKHGMVDFTYPDPAGYQVKVSNSRTRTAPALWETAGDGGRRVGVVSLPMTYPPQPLNGFMLCSFLTPDDEGSYTYPESLKEELMRAVGTFPMHMSEQGRGTDPARFVRSVKEMEIQRARSVNYLLENEAWDLFVYVFETTDNLQHEVWHLLDDEHPRHDPQLASRVMPAILDYYQTVDRLLGEMVERVPEDALVVVLSDHGFGPFDKFFHVNNWLAELGLLKFRRSPLSLLKRLAFHLGVTPINALKWVIRLRLSGMRRNVKRGRGRGMLRRVFLSFADVDWKRTKAFSVGNFGQVYLNVNPPRPSGPVSVDDYEVLRDYIAREALSLRDPVDGSQIVRKVYKREEVFHGDALYRLPDLVLHTDRARYVSFGHADFGSNKVIEESIGQSGHHHMVGVLAMHGPGVRSGLALNESSILDLAPTILHYLGLDVPDHMDGTVLSRALTDDFNHANPIQNSHISPEHSSGDDSYTPDEEEAVIAKLRDMGYVA